MVLRKLDVHMQKNEVGASPWTPYTKINSVSIKGLSLRAKIMKLLDENRGENLHGFGFGNHFLETTPKA